MTNAGWYPDPAGAPDTFRYWDGQAWSQMTTTNPSSGGERPGQDQAAPPPAEPTAYGQPQQFGQQPQQPQQPQQYGQSYGQQPEQPQQFAQYGQQPYGQQYGQQQWSPGTQGGSGGGNGKTIGIVVAAALVLVLLGVGGFFGIRALSGDDDGDRKADDSSSEGTDDATDGGTDGGDDPTDGTSIAPTGIQCTGGNPTPENDPGETPATLTGGGLTIPRLEGYTVSLRASEAHSFADGILVSYLPVTDNWVSEYAVGGLPRDNGFDDPAQAAEIIMQCLTTNDQIYSGFDSRKDLENKEVTVDGRPGHQITSEIRVSDPAITVEGDVTTVIVVDTGDEDSFGLYLGVVSIGDDERIAQQEEVAGQIKVG